MAPQDKRAGELCRPSAAAWGLSSRPRALHTQVSYNACVRAHVVLTFLHTRLPGQPANITQPVPHQPGTGRQQRWASLN